MKTNKALVEYCRAQLGKPYWFGTFGQTATESILQYNKSRFPSSYAASDFRSQLGQRVHDCAGLIKGFIWSDSPNSAPRYQDGCPDISADQMKLNCTETGTMDTLPELPGVLLFKPSHVGVYIGNGKAIEAKGHAYGVVQSDVKKRGWASWGKFKYIEYEEIPMEYAGKAKLKIYINSARKTMTQVKEETGCTAIINGGLFDMARYKPIAQLKADGIVYANEDWGVNYGIGFDPLKLTADMTSVQNFIGCICMVRNGAAVKMSYPADMGGARQRTALGIMPDGKVWMYATLTKTTPEALQKLALGKGVKDAIMLDGGASTQGQSPTSKVQSSRIVHNFILAFEGGVNAKPTCPYAEPTYNLRRGSKGTAVKWLQWMLNQYGNTLNVDGDFGAKTNSALLAFQKAHGLEADAVCGPLTRTKLKEGIA